MANAPRLGEGRSVVFLLNLVQDVNILRPLVYLTRRETGAQVRLLVSDAFIKRDRQKIWQREVAALATDTDASVHLYGSPAEALAVLAGGSGMIFAASESNLPAHHETSGVLQAAPATYLRVTLQHGLECIGFVQSREHTMSHGRKATFSADVLCSWFEPESLSSLTLSQRSKLYVTGPPTLLQQARAHPDECPARGGLVCENMHSVRLRASGDHKSSFMETFQAFCAAMESRGEAVTLRPHPGGQYVLKNKVGLPRNVELEMRPLYEANLAAYKFGISAPSTIIFDMVLAGIPVAVWRDPAGVMDASNYDGLTEISTLDDWLAFERDVRLRPAMILERQRTFLQRLRMPTDPAEIYRRFARLIVAALAGLPGDALAGRSDGAGLRGSTKAVAARPASLSGNLLVEAAP